MPLTPADVHNVAFSKPPIGKRGYNEDEVDAFLDLVEGELARLIEENNDLRQQVEQLDQQLETSRADLDDARAKASSSPMTSRMPVEEPRRRRRSRRLRSWSRRPPVVAETTTCRPRRSWVLPRRWRTG
jgi:DivIVA domain-containing protein